MLPGLRNKPLIKRLGLADLSASVQSLINGALQKSGGTMLADILLPGNTSQALGAVPKQQLDAAVASAAPSGSVAAFAMSTAPTGWLKANGAAISRSTYATLFAAIGTTFGAGDGSTTFNLPDLRGEFVRGWDDGRGIDAGRTFGSGQAGQMPSHTHSLAASGGAGATVQIAGSNSQSPGSVSTNATGGTENGSENRPRNVALLFCIKF